MKHYVTDEWYSLELMEANPHVLFVFGDNLTRKGKGGQACVREAENAVGIATKLLPAMTEDSFFESEEQAIDTITYDLAFALEMSKRRNKPLVFPSTGLGNGLAKLDTMYPEAYEYLNDQITKLVEQDYPVRQ